MTQSSETSLCLFEIKHGSTILKIEDDWSGHVLIEKIYEGLRQARKARDAGRLSVSTPEPGSEAESAIIEDALFRGFERVDDGSTYRATAGQIVALVMAAREYGRDEALRVREARE